MAGRVRRRDLELTDEEEAQLRQLNEEASAWLKESLAALANGVPAAARMEIARQARRAADRLTAGTRAIYAAARRRAAERRAREARERKARAEREALRTFAQPLGDAAGSPAAPYRSPTSAASLQVEGPASDARSEGRPRP